VTGFLDEDDTHTALLRFDSVDGPPIPALTVPGLRLDGLAPQQMIVAAERHVSATLQRAAAATISHPVDQDGVEGTLITVVDPDDGTLLALSSPQIDLDPPPPAAS
jgi:hypothetical protein